MIAPAPPVRQPDPTAVIGRRIVAYLIDYAAVIAITIGAGAAVLSSGDVPAGSAPRRTSAISSTTARPTTSASPHGDTIYVGDGGDFGTVLLVGLVAFLVMQVVLPALTGFSPGKAITGLRIVKADTFEKAGLGANLVRWLLWIADSAPWCFPLVGLITGLSSNGHRRVGDMAAYTLVVDRHAVGHPVAITGSVGPPPPLPARGLRRVGDTAGCHLRPLRPSPRSVAPTRRSPCLPSRAGHTAAGQHATAPDPASHDADLAAPTTSTTPAASRPGIDIPQWDAARDTYIQWDPDLGEWMEWSETQGAWISISQ
ncbi:MAG: RDD family protein [Acidimicrobiales bacterium]